MYDELINDDKLTPNKGDIELILSNNESEERPLTRNQTSQFYNTTKINDSITNAFLAAEAQAKALFNLKIIYNSPETGGQEIELDNMNSQEQLMKAWFLRFTRKTWALFMKERQK